MTWHEVRVQEVVQQVREAIDPSDLDHPLVEHYSIPSLEATGQPDLVPPDEILSGKQVLQGGEVMLSRLNPRKARVLRVPQSMTYPTVASGEFVIMKATDIDGDYLVYVLLSEEVRQHLHSCVQSVTRSHQRIRPDHLLKMSVRIPGRDTQVATVAYLDRETAKIDTLIAKKRLLLERLAEYRTALITRTVTKGLPPKAAIEAGFDPNPSMKSSSVAWIDDVPEHWEVAQLRRYVRRIKTGTTPPANDLNELAGDEVAWFSPGDIASVLQMKLPSRTLANRAVSDGFTPLFPPESTLIVGIGATAGRVGHNTRPSTGNQQLTCIVGNDRVFPRFLSWQLWARTEEIRAIAPFATLPILNNDFLLSLSFLAPSLGEQQAIAAFLDEHTEQIDVLGSRVEAAIERLQEYRTALITAAVTGKIDVRDHEQVKAGASV